MSGDHRQTYVRINISMLQTEVIFPYFIRAGTRQSNVGTSTYHHPSFPRHQSKESLNINIVQNIVNELLIAILQ